jgi:SM-20-related protein
MTTITQTAFETEETVLEGMLETISTQGFAIVDNFLPDASIQALHQQAKSLQSDGSLHQAGVGKGADKLVLNKLRGDSIYWLDNDTDSAAQSTYLAKMEQLRTAFNQQFFMGLFEFETHFAIYPPGGVYHKHLDQFKGQHERQISAILYLNQDWQKDDGGELRLYLNGTTDDSHIDIMPVGGRLILFLSARFLHEVLPAKRERISLTGWFRTRSQAL